MKIVRFSDGNWGIRKRKWIFWKQFKVISATPNKYWRSISDSNFWECRAKEADVKRVYGILTDKGKVVKKIT